MFIDELKRTKAKLKTAKPNIKPAIQNQIKRLEESIAKDNEELKLLIGEKEAAEKEVGDEAANKAKIDELTGKINALKSEVPSFYERALAIDPAYYDALYQLGAYYFNEGAEIKRIVNGMDMATYQKEGKAVEAKLAEKYQMAVPFFERALKVKKDEDLKEILKQIYRELKIDKQID